jgi:glutathione S-transferase
VEGRIYTEAPALLVYIASLKPEADLLPGAGATDLARTLEWLAWFSSSLHIAYAQLWRPERFLPEGSDSAPLVEQGRVTIVRMNGEVEERLAGPWLVGERFSLADIYSLPFYRWGNRIGLDMRQSCPHWTGVVERLLLRPAVAEALAAEGLERSEFLPG